jgi:beta-lactamase regulating signal transducer with metallopeptidase domain
MTATQIVEVLASYSLQVLIVLLSGKLLERALTRSTDRCAVWNICFFSVLFLGCAALLLPRLHLFQPWSRLAPHELLTVTAVQAMLGKGLLAIWSIGASLLLLKWMVRTYFLRRSLCRCEQLSKENVQHLLATADASVDDEHLPIVLISDESDGPYCWQLHRPTIVLPRFLLDGDRADLRNVLIHELEHLKTNHPFQLFMQQLAQVLCWFHPTVWSAAWRASLAREYTCDDAAAAQGANSAAYLRTLLHIAEKCERNTRASVIGFGRTESEIVLRARRLVKLAQESTIGAQRGILGRKVATCILLVVACIASQVWIPSDPLASRRAAYSPWPSWSAEVLHCFGYNCRDYELNDWHGQIYELQHEYLVASHSERASLAQGSTGR